MKKLMTTALALVFGGIASVVIAQDQTGGEAQQQQQPDRQQVQPADLDELLNNVREGRLSESQQHRQREAEFRARRDRQDQLLREANEERTQEERMASQLERSIQQNDERIRELDRTLTERLGELKEMFGVLQQVAGDVRGNVQNSIATVQYGREERLDGLTNLIQKASRSSTLPKISEIEVLWQQMLLEMKASGEVSRFDKDIVSVEGDKETVEIARVGLFNLVSDGKYYDYLAENGVVQELPRQPAGRFTSSTARLMDADPGDTVAFGLDPTRGQLLGLLIQRPDLTQRINQGAEVGYVIIALGIIGVLISAWKMISLSLTSAKVRGQMKNVDTPKENNPLGRVLKAYQDNTSVDVETLELKLDEAILRETPALERGLTFIKIISAVAPLLGLLGTVTGMIVTFEAITLFGTGDPSLMANGISQALITTVLGLVVAIPTLLLHSFVAGMSKRVIHVLEEQSAGMIALHAEKERKGAGTA